MTTLPPIYIIPTDPSAAAPVRPLHNTINPNPLAQTLGKWSLQTPTPPPISPPISPPIPNTTNQPTTSITWSGQPKQSNNNHNTNETTTSDDQAPDLPWLRSAQTSIRDRLAELAPHLTSLNHTLAIRPHADHPISDLPALLWLAAQYPLGPYTTCLDPTSILTPAMQHLALDHYRRCAEVGQYLITQNKLTALILPDPAPNHDPDHAIETLAPLILAAPAIILTADSTEHAHQQAQLLVKRLT